MIKKNLNISQLYMAYDKENYEKNKERIKAYRRKWYHKPENKKKISDGRKLYYVKNSAKIIQRAIDWRKANPDRYESWRKNYFEVNKDKVKEGQIRYYILHEDEIKEKKRLRRLANLEKYRNIDKIYNERRKETKHQWYLENKLKVKIQSRIRRMKLKLLKEKDRNVKIKPTKQDD